MNTIIAIIGGLSALLGLLTAWPPTGGKIASMANASRQARAFARIKGLKGVREMAIIRFDSADAGGGSAPMLGPDARWKIQEFSAKRIVMSTVIGKVSYTTQCSPVEFEAGRAYVLRDV